MLRGTASNNTRYVRRLPIVVEKHEHDQFTVANVTGQVSWGAAIRQMDAVDSTGERASAIESAEPTGADIGCVVTGRLDCWAMTASVAHISSIREVSIYGPHRGRMRPVFKLYPLAASSPTKICIHSGGHRPFGR